MNYKHFSSMTIAVLLMTFCCITTSAEIDIRLLQGYVNEENLDLFLPCELDEDSLCIKVANQETEIFDVGVLSEEEIAVRTTILVDNSTSIPVATRGKVAEFLDYKIMNISKNEEVKIVQFGSEIKTLQDFTNDRYDLDKAADLIEYNGTESQIYDAVYNTIPKISTVDNEPCFYRTIVVTDGADYTAQGITKEELFMRLKIDTYPIDVVCVSKSESAHENKDLSALTRISNGRYFEIYPESDAFALVSDLSVSNFFWVRTEVPVSLLDGSTRQVDVSDGSNSLSFDMKMSVVDVPVVESSEPEFAESQIESVVSYVQPASITTSTESIPNDELTSEISTATIVFIAVGVGFAAIVAIIIIAIVKKKKQLEDNIERNNHPGSDVLPDDNDETEFLGEGEQYVIRISNASNPSENWIINVTSEVMIGRAVGCTIKLDEKSVSREQCKIFLKNTGLVLSNVSSSNPTKLNGKTVTDGMLLHPADNIHFGRVTLRVDYIQKIGQESDSPNIQDDIHNHRDTESMF